MMKKKALIAGVLLSVCSINMGVQAAFHSKIDINTDKDITYKTSILYLPETMTKHQA